MLGNFSFNYFNDHSLCMAFLTVDLASLKITMGNVYEDDAEAFQFGITT